MRLKAESVLILILLFSVSTTAFDIQSVRAVTIRVPDDYLTIQEAIDAASPGETIIVSGGFYSEGEIEIYKPLTLIANGEVIVDGELVYLPWDPGQAVFLVTANDVTIKGFTVVNTWSGEAGILLYDVKNGRHVNNCRIEQNMIQHHDFGIFVIGFENVIRENSFSHNMFDVLLGGKRADVSGFNVVEDNLMSSTIGIIVHGNSNHNIIKKNSVLTQAGIILHDGTHDNTILRNVITATGTGIEIAGSNNNTIRRNVISSKNGGIHLHRSSERNVIAENVVLDNSQAGIYLREVSHNTVEKNMIRENQDGIYLESSDHNALKTNIVIKNARYGIAVTTESDHNTIHKNIVLRNSEFDLYWDELGQGNIWERNVYKTKNW